MNKPGSSFIVHRSSFIVHRSTRRRNKGPRDNRRVATAPDTPVQFLKGVGASRAKTLQEYGLATAGDLLWFFPFRYEDRRHPTPIADLGHHLDEPVLVRGRVISAHSRVSPLQRMKIFEVVLEDESSAVKLVWFSQQ